MEAFAVLFVILVSLAVIAASKCKEHCAEVSENSFVVRYNPKPDITVYELARLPTYVNGFCLNGHDIVINRNNEIEMATWNGIPALMKRHFDIVEEK